MTQEQAEMVACSIYEDKTTPLKKLHVYTQLNKLKNIVLQKFRDDVCN